MNLGVLIAVVLLIVIILLEIKGARKSEPKEHKIKDYLSFSNNTFYDLLFSFAFIKITEPLYESIRESGTFIYAISIMIGIAIIYFGAKTSRYYIYKTFNG